jgi:hypothetical protein
LVYLGIVAALVYYATQVFVHKGTTMAEGWYLTSFIPIEAILFVVGAHSLLGAGGRWLVILGAMTCLALVIYSGLFVALPYYAGFTHHSPSGGLTSFHPLISDFPIMGSRLLRYQLAVPRLLPWLLLLNFAVLGSYRILKPHP